MGLQGARAFRRALILGVAVAAFAVPGHALAAGGTSVDQATPLALNTADFGPYSTGQTIWWKYSAGATPPAEVTLNGCGLTEFNDALTVYSGPATNPTLGSLVLVNSNADDPGCGGGLARVKFAPTANTTYYFELTGTASGAQTYQVRFDPTPTNDDFANASALTSTATASATGTNIGATNETGEPNTGGGGATVWWTWQAPSSGVATISSCRSSINPYLKVYTGSSVGALTAVTSAPTNCSFTPGAQTFTATAGTIYRIAVDGWNGVVAGGDTGGIEVDVGMRPANDDLANATALSTLPVTVDGNNLAATKETNENDHAGSPGGQSIWYRWTAPSSGTVTVDTCGGATNVNTLLAVYVNGSSFPLTPIASNDDSCGERSSLTFSAVASTTYAIAIDSVGPGGNVQLHIAGDTTPPNTVIDTGPTVGNDTTPSFTFHSTEANSTFECSMTLSGSSFSPCSSPFTAPALTGGDGTYTFRVRATDASSNTDLTPATRTYVLDTVAPPKPTFTRTPPKRLVIKHRKVKVKFEFNAAGAATYHCALDKGKFKLCTSPAKVTVKPGKHKFFVSATDAAGNTGPAAKYRFKVVKH